jgi:SWI/SNF related-matrix-associated actin-dependent regulator of chromatin subfamily C
MENPSYSTLPDRDAPWTDEETLLLLEGLEKFDENWADIAAYVGTRTREECVVKFLQLEIEDKYLDSEPVPNSTTGMGLLNGQGHIPFSQADNPVLSVVGFLAGLTDPSVTAAAAGKSVEDMKRSLREKLEMPSDGHVVSEKGKEKDSGDMMEIDVRHETTTTTTTTTATLSSLATIPLAIAAARAGSLATHEEREMTRLVSAAVNVTLQKFELKLQQFNEMESILQAERRELERGRQQLFLDRLSFKKRVKDVQDGLKMAAATGGEQGIKLAQDVMATNEKLTFNGNVQGADSVFPLSSEGPIKTYEI